MADLSQSIMRTKVMTAIEDVIENLAPALKELVGYLSVSSQLEALGFFSHVEQSLSAVTTEDELLEVFILMSMMAFQGFRLDPTASMLADQILAQSEQVSHAFSADSSSVN